MAVYQKRGDWWIDYYYQGKRCRQKIGTRKKDAEQALSQIRIKITAGEFVPMEERQPEEEPGPPPVLFSDFAKNEYLPWSEVQHSAKHHKLQNSIVKVQLIPCFGEIDLHSITTKMLEDYITRRSQGFYLKGKKKRPVKPATVNRDIACLKILFRKAVDWGRLEVSPARGIKAFKEIPNPPRLLEPEEITALLAHIPDRHRALVCCALYAGLRREELFHLRWEDIHWKAGQLCVVSREEHHTKNYETRRIPMNDALQEALRHHKQNHIVVGSGYVFGNKEGKPYDNIRKALKTTARQAGITEGVGLHQLRHAFCSHALMQGIDPRTVQKWMGHRDLKTTLRYAHLSPDHEKTAIQRLTYTVREKDGEYAAMTA